MTLPPYYSDGLVTLHLGDCLEVLETLPGESVDIVVTSPPYNMGLKPGGNGRGIYRASVSGSKAGRFRDGYGAHDDAMPHDEYCVWQRRVLAECWRVARLGVFYNHRPRVEHGVLREPLDGDYGLPLRQRIIWDRDTGIDVNLRNFCTRQEYILLFAKPAFSLVSHSASGMGDIWRLGMERNVDGHPAPFPVKLPARCIEATGAQSVLDPFAGSGTTLLAARNAGIQGIGIENWEPYCELAVRRYRGERYGTDGGVQMPLGALRQSRRHQVKLTITAEEMARLEDARRLLGEINTSLRQRGITVYFCVTTARDGVLDRPGLVIETDATL